MTSHNQHKQNQKLNPYLRQKILSAGPEQLIAYVYDAGVTACSNRDSVKARIAVNTLMKSLNFEYKEIATTFFNVYRHLNYLINRKQFDSARAIFSELKQTWSKAFQVH